MRIVLKAERIAYVLDGPLPESPIVDSYDEYHNAYQKHLDDNVIATCIILASMSPELQKQHEAMIAHAIIVHLKELFHEQARSERFEVSKLLFFSKMQERTSPVKYALKMNGYIVRLDQLGFRMDNELSIDFILAGLPYSFAQFVLNYRMNDKETSIPKLINLLKTVEPTLKKEGKIVMLVDSFGSKNKKKRKITKKKEGAAKKKAKETSSKGTCFHCGKEGHWKINCKAYMESKMKVAFDAPSSSGIYVIEVNTVSRDNLWVLDTDCGSHICNYMQGLRNSRRLAKGESDIQVSNGARVAAIAIRTYVLNLPSGLCLNLDNFFYVPASTKNIIYVSCLNKNGFHLNFHNSGCYIMLNDVFYIGGTLSNGIYILDMSNPILNVNDNKIQKGDNLKSSFLWHCPLGHINKMHMTKLNKSGSLGSFDYESFDTCESCLLGKMTKLPFKGKGERASGPLDLIHTNVCGPMSMHAKGGFIYFITLIDD